MQAQVRSTAADGSRTISIGTLVTPPAGEYRFVLLHADGAVDAREILTFNGPQPSVTYIGGAQLPAAVARDALAAIDATSPESATSSDLRAPCVLAFVSASGGEWRGCAFAALAADVLARVPHLTVPDVSDTCFEQSCQLRFLSQTSGAGHASTGMVNQDIVFDRSGAFWCAAIGRGPQPTASLRVVRGRADSARSEGLFQWLAAPVNHNAVDEPSPLVSESVMVRGHAGTWSQLRPREAQEARSRLKRIAEKLPQECQPRS